MIVAETLIELLKDPNHQAFELINEVVHALFYAGAARIWVKYHDRKHHKHEHCNDVHDREFENG